MKEGSSVDREILRRLADRKARLAALPVQAETKEGWRRLNDLEPGKPMVWINEICWHELRQAPELACACTDPFLRGIEQDLRREQYQWEHLPVDMVVEDVVRCPLAIHDSGFGIDEETDIVRTDATSDVVSRHFHRQIQREEDLEKIRTPVVRHDEAESRRRLDLLRSLIGDLIRVEPCGIPGSWFAPWDELCRWWGPQEALMDLIERPALVHAAMDRLLNAYLARLDQWEQLNLLASNLGNHRIGSGGLGYTRHLPPTDADPAHWRAQDLWGSATAQIFSEVSPAMHEEFALEYELRWLKRWGLTYYGCCEPLHLKLEMLKRRVPNLRKISMSPKADLERAVPQIGRAYVISHKPNPAVLATDAWNVTQAEQDLRAALDRYRGACVEVILKDISTIRYEPGRLHDWAAMARRVTAEYA